MITGAMLQAVLWGASNFFGRQLSQFAAGAITAAIVGGVVIGGSAWALHSAYAYGVDQTEAKWQAKALQSKLDAAKADLDAARASEGLAKLQVASIKDKMEHERKADAEYIKELEGRSGKDGKPCGCDLTDADRRGMRDNQNDHSASTRPSRKAIRPFRRSPGAAAIR